MDTSYCKTLNAHILICSATSAGFLVPKASVLHLPSSILNLGMGLCMWVCPPVWKPLLQSHNVYNLYCIMNNFTVRNFFKLIWVCTVKAVT